jgi:tetratricopeptide repeat protein 8
MDPLYLALSQLRRRQHAACIDSCTSLLDANAYDQAAWYLKCRATTAQSFIDDTDMEDEGVAELLLDENAIASAPRYASVLIVSCAPRL